MSLTCVGLAVYQIPSWVSELVLALCVWEDY